MNNKMISLVCHRICSTSTLKHCLFPMFQLNVRAIASSATPRHYMSSTGDASKEDEEDLESRKRAAARAHVTHSVFGTSPGENSASLYAQYDGGTPQGLDAHCTSSSKTGSSNHEWARIRASTEQNGVQNGEGGKDGLARVFLARLLKEHQVVIRGGPAEAVLLVDSLMAWREGKWQPQDS